MKTTLVPPPSSQIVPPARFLCHILCDKSRGGLLALALLGAGAVRAGEAPASCCASEPVKKASCCAPVEGENQKTAAEAFSNRSLYQADAVFTTDAGEEFHLGQLRGRPVVLTMFFASCGYACPLLAADMAAIRAQLPAEVRARAAFVLVSFDSVRDTPAALKKYRDERGLDAQWTLLHGSDDAVRELAALLGVKFRREADGNFAHSNLITLLNTEGEIIHQRTGLKGGLAEAAQALAALP
ncbi:MAG TPA: SCO family protein [Lacunisphaera sp.]|nr:SCO family protein [Lacunisphaera sp.]